MQQDELPFSRLMQIASDWDEVGVVGCFFGRGEGGVEWPGDKL